MLDTTRPPFEAAMQRFLFAAQQASDRDYDAGQNPKGVHEGPRLVAEPMRRYIRVVSEHHGSRRAWRSWTSATAMVSSPGGWKRPARGARGNIYDDQHGCARVH